LQTPIQQLAISHWQLAFVSYLPAFLLKAKGKKLLCSDVDV
jgi:hypothetical protein